MQHVPCTVTFAIQPCILCGLALPELLGGWKDPGNYLIRGKCFLRFPQIGGEALSNREGLIATLQASDSAGPVSTRSQLSQMTRTKTSYPGKRSRLSILNKQ